MSTDRKFCNRPRKPDLAELPPSQGRRNQGAYPIKLLSAKIEATLK